MSYSINNPAKNEYLLIFNFERQSCDVHVSVRSLALLHLESLTDGYHWLGDFLSQDPDASELSFIGTEEQEVKINETLKPYGIRYEPEDKETAFLHLSKAFDLRQLEKIADLLEERFALREKFYD